MPGPSSDSVMRTSSSVISTSMSPPCAWMARLISPSYSAMDTLRMAVGGSPSFLSRDFRSALASPARVKSSPGTV